MVGGEAGLGIGFEAVELTQVVGLVLGTALAEGGLGTRWPAIRPVLAPSLLLATLGVAATAAVTHTSPGRRPADRRPLRVVVSSTDAAAVFAVLRSMPLRRRLHATLETVSGFSDSWSSSW